MQGMAGAEGYKTPPYGSIWTQCVLQGVMQEGVLPPAVMQSWQRCAALGHDPYGESGPADHAPLTSPAVSHTLLSLVRPALEDLHQFVEESGCVVVFADAKLRIVDRFGDQEMQEKLQRELNELQQKLQTIASNIMQAGGNA